MNPNAGMRKGSRALADIISIFNRGGYSDYLYDRCHRGCLRITQDRCAQVDLVVCAGGDSTFNKTINGILQSGTDVPVGYIPYCGSTNDFATSLKLPTSIPELQSILWKVRRCATMWVDSVSGIFLMWPPLAHLPRRLIPLPECKKCSQVIRHICWRAFRNCPRSVQSMCGLKRRIG